MPFSRKTEWFARNHAMVIDFHAHAFPDSLAERAVSSISGRADVRARLDGRVSSLLASMDRAGIEKSVVCSIATRESQFEPIIKWSAEISGARIVPFPSLVPTAPDAAEKVALVAREGFRGIKIHPYYQDFHLDDRACFPFYEAVSEAGLILASHTGFDFAFPPTRRADPARVLKITREFPRLKFVATHLGGWKDWDEVDGCLLGKPVYLEISFAFGYLEGETIRRFLLSHPAEYLLFGTDTPWTDQGETLASLRALGLPPEREQLLLSGNALRLLTEA